jgi:hypothetical protein
MAILPGGDDVPGDDVYVYGSMIAGDSTAWIERRDARTLDVCRRVESLPGGPWWPGGVAATEHGLVLVHGRWAHRLSANLDVLAARELPRPRPYNSFVALTDGHLVTKDFGRHAAEPAQLLVLDPIDLDIVARAPVPEPSIARVAAQGDDVYVIGDHTAYRFRWDGRLVRDDAWEYRYRTRDDQSYGWDPVIALGAAWFLDNGDHTYNGSMRGQGVALGPVHLVRVPLEDPRAATAVDVCGAPRGAVTNPPLVDERSGIAVAYDSANGVIAAFRHDGGFTRMWSRDLDTAGHLVCFPDDGALVAYDHRDHEDVVFLDLATGTERARVDTGSPVQSVVFPAAGDGVVYYCSFTTIARIASANTSV